jgi:hypothetical protein
LQDDVLAAGAPKAGSASSFTSQDCGSQNDDCASIVIGCTRTSAMPAFLNWSANQSTVFALDGRPENTTPTMARCRPLWSPGSLSKNDDAFEVGANRGTGQLGTGRLAAGSVTGCGAR